MPKATTPTAARQGRRHNPLESDIIATGPLKAKSAKRKSRHEENGEKFVDSKSSQNILRIGQELADEDAEENAAQNPVVNSAFDFESRFEDEDEDEEEPSGDLEAWGDEDDDIEEEMVAPGDREMFDRFNPTDDDPLLRKGWTDDIDLPAEDAPTNLADMILEKIAAFEAAQARGDNPKQEPGPVDDFEIPPKVVEVYQK